MKVNLYKNCGEWCYAAFDGAEFDHSDTLDLPFGATEEWARKEVLSKFPNATVERVADTENK